MARAGGLLNPHFQLWGFVVPVSNYLISDLIELFEGPCPLNNIPMLLSHMTFQLLPHCQSNHNVARIIELGETEVGCWRNGECRQ